VNIGLDIIHILLSWEEKSVSPEGLNVNFAF